MIHSPCRVFSSFEDGGARLRLDATLQKPNGPTEVEPFNLGILAAGDQPLPPIIADQ
jgi:hypothetical protein